MCQGIFEWDISTANFIHRKLPAITGVALCYYLTGFQPDEMHYELWITFFASFILFFISS